jgi:hypothetical protein
LGFFPSANLSNLFSFLGLNFHQNIDIKNGVKKKELVIHKGSPKLLGKKFDYLSFISQNECSLHCPIFHVRGWGWGNN